VCSRSCVGPSVGAWLFAHLAIPCFHLPSDVFSFVLWTRLGLPHPLVLNLTHYIYDQLLDPMGIHLLHYVHGGERVISHDVIWDVFASIVKNVRFHILQKQTHVLMLPSLQSSCWQVDIILLVDDVHTLVDVVIINLIPHLKRLGIPSNFFSWGDYDNGNSSERKISSRPLLNEHVFSSCHKGFWVFLATNWQLFSSIC